MCVCVCVCNPKQHQEEEAQEVQKFLDAGGDLDMVTDLLVTGADPNVPDEVSRRDMQTKTPNTAP